MSTAFSTYLIQHHETNVTTMSTQHTAIECLYQARDELDTAVNRLPSLPPAEITQELSSYYRVSLLLLHNSCTLIHALREQAEQAHSVNPHVHAALAEMSTISTDLARSIDRAEYVGQPIVDVLHHDETPGLHNEG